MGDNQTDSDLDPIAAEIAAAETLYKQRRARSEHFDELGFVEPGWDMLLFLFIHQRRPVTVDELCEAGQVLRTTGLRYINHLESIGSITRTEWPQDRRIQHVALNATTHLSMRLYLSAPLGGRQPHDLN